MARKKKAEQRQRNFIEFEKKLIDFTEKKINLGTAVNKKWQTIEPVLQKWIKHKSTNYNIELADFMGSSDIRVIRYIHNTIPPGVDPQHYKLSSDILDLTSDEDLKILYIKNKKKFLLVPQCIGDFITINYDFKLSGWEGDVLDIVERVGESEEPKYNILPVYRKNDSEEMNLKYEHEYEPVREFFHFIKNKHIPSVAIINDEHFLICVSSESSIKNLISYRQELSDIFNRHFVNKRGRPKSKDHNQILFNIEFTALRKQKNKISIDDACAIIADKHKEELGGIDWRTLKRHYYPVWKKYRGAYARYV